MQIPFGKHCCFRRDCSTVAKYLGFWKVAITSSVIIWHPSSQFGIICYKFSFTNGSRIFKIGANVSIIPNKSTGHVYRIIKGKYRISFLISIFET